VNAKRLTELTLALVLWYFLAGLVFERVLAVFPPGSSREAFFLAGAALPWSALLLDFLEPAHSALGGVVQESLFLVLIAGGIALNAWLADRVLVRLLRRLPFFAAPRGRRGGSPPAAPARKPAGL
jgi:hypothetical protein